MSERPNVRALRRRILLGTVAVALLFYGIWRAWDLDARLFWELLGGAVGLVLVLALAGAFMGMLLRLFRRLFGR